MKRLHLELNTIDNRWKVLDSAGFPFGEGETIDEAIQSARIVTDKPIFRFDIETGDYYEV